MTLLRKHDSLPGEHSTDHRQETAQRLLDSSARLSYDPELEIDWDAPLVDGKYGMTPEWCSLYGTDLWERMSEDQRITLTEHEAASIAGTGIWFEMILMQMLVRDLYRHDPATPYVQFGLTEIADECRHSIMFARSAQRYGIPSYRPKRWIRETGRLFKAVARGALAYGGTLFAEEILDMMQRDFMRDERVQPVTRAVSKIHVLEEARHIRFAREEVARRLAGASRTRLAFERFNTALVVFFVVKSMIHPDVYTNAGLDRERALQEAKGNKHYHDRVRKSGAKLMTFLDNVGLIGGPSKILYKKVHLL